VIYSQWIGYLSYSDTEYFGAEAMAGYQNDPQVNLSMPTPAAMRLLPIYRGLPKHLSRRCLYQCILSVERDLLKHLPTFSSCRITLALT